MSKRVLELIRVSTEMQAAEDRAGIPAQRAANRRTAAQYGLEIVKSFELSDVSGAAILLAPEMQSLLRMIQSPDIHGVVTREFSRLMRPENFSDYALLQAFVDSQTTLYLPDGPIDLTSKSGRLLGTIRAAVAGLERTEILERMWSGKEAKRRAGKNPQSRITLPFGVDYNKQRGWFYTGDAERVREAIRLFLAGEVNYRSVGEKLGIDPWSLRIILRNPIYSGWRVITQRRDPSPGARRTKPDGRQADRPKVLRAPEDVIRLKVLDPPLVSEEDFARLQVLLDFKKQKHWRTKPDYEHRFTYNGFLVCGGCGEVVYTHWRRDDYYVCKARKLKAGCESRYMRRDVLEQTLDMLFGYRLTDRAFLADIATAWEQAAQRATDRDRVSRLEADLQANERKRERVVESYIEGLLTREGRDCRVAVLDREARILRDLLMQEPRPATLDAEELADAFSPFTEWEFLSRKDKRQLLSTLAPEVRVRNYQIQGVLLCRNSVRRSPVDFSMTGAASATAPRP